MNSQNTRRGTDVQLEQVATDLVPTPRSPLDPSNDIHWHDTSLTCKEEEVILNTNVSEGGVLDGLSSALDLSSQLYDAVHKIDAEIAAETPVRLRRVIFRVSVRDGAPVGDWLRVEKGAKVEDREPVEDWVLVEDVVEVKDAVAVEDGVPIEDGAHIENGVQVEEHPCANLDVEPLVLMLTNGNFPFLSQASLCVGILHPEDTEQILCALQRFPNIMSLEIILSGITGPAGLPQEVSLIRGLEFFLQLSDLTLPESLLSTLLQAAVGRLPNLRRLCISPPVHRASGAVPGASRVFLENLQQDSCFPGPFETLETLRLGIREKSHVKKIQGHLPYVTIV